MKVELILLFLLLTVTTVSAQRKFATYHNERFAYSIEYPSDLLKMQPPPENGDGREFDSRDGSVKLLVWGNYNASDQSWKQWYKSDLKDFLEKPAYTVVKNHWYVISGLKNDKIFYQKTMRRTLRQKLGNIDVFYTFTIEYPESERSKFDPIVRHIAASFKFDPKADV